MSRLFGFASASRRSMGSCLSGALLLAAGCSQQAVTVQLHPLQQSGDVSYVCRVAPGAGESGRGVPLSECSPGSVVRGERDLFALVTQTSTGEIAVINVPPDLDRPARGEGVVDLDRNTPGFGFLPVGALPGDIVTTPGGFASFVGVGEAGKPGLFALPTEKLSAPSDGAGRLDITSFPACSLPATPGSIALVVEPPAADGTVYTSCDRTAVAQEGTLKGEGGPLGRRKLLVSLPDLGSLAVIDAEAVLQLEAGTFQPCPLDAPLFPLAVSMPAQPLAPLLPDDLQPTDPTCSPFALPQPPPVDAAFRASPAGFALADDGTLYIADATAPVIHVVDARNPCSLSEGLPLYPGSFDVPGRTVTTSRLAVSPLTPSAKRFVYAIDQYDWPTASIMAFDVSPGSTNRAPLVRPRSALIQTEAPDRIQLPAAPKDLSFVERDRPVVDVTTGSAVVGEVCDPDPRNSTAVGASYRTSADYRRGARPLELRGVFASVLLSNGQINFVDVEDYDAPCRRPVTANVSDVEDFRGCRNDPPEIPVYETRGTATVSNEVSCQMVEPHRLRASSFGITSGTLGILAPSLRSLPQFRSAETALQSTPAERPKLLGVDFDYGDSGKPPDRAQVFVGSTLFERGDETADPGPNDLVIDPTKASRDSVVLPFNEPRAYPSSNNFVLSYEGLISGALTTGFLNAGAALPGLAASDLVLRDSSVGYCDLGVNDVVLMKSVAERLGVPEEQREQFAEAHADYVVITADFPEPASNYWTESRTRADCEAVFGKFDDKLLRDTREFTIVDAQQQILALSSRAPFALMRELRDQIAEARAARKDVESLDAEMERVQALALENARKARECFPEGTRYVVRASDQWVLRSSAEGFRHQVVARWRKDGPADYLECELDCNPRKQYFESRVFEIHPSTSPQEYCRRSKAAGHLELDRQRPDYEGGASRCVHRTPTERFAVYRGAAPSVRDMTFSWQTIGGFFPLRMDLGAVSAAVLPQNLVAVPAFDWLSVVDASSLGLALLSLDTLKPLTPTIY